MEVLLRLNDDQVKLELKENVPSLEQPQWREMLEPGWNGIRHQCGAERTQAVKLAVVVDITLLKKPC